ncbi:MAG: hypothetical protein DRJ03_28430 [Chloroflexi bacterium]|nr:MAG: hypothetical protein DRJ03_28430 [Chloroflexota bacterium]
MEEKFRVAVPKAQLDKLKIYKAQIADIEAEIARAEKAGLDVAGLRARLELAKERIDKILAVYGKE